jgi:hypothetical protein
MGKQLSPSSLIFQTALIDKKTPKENWERSIKLAKEKEECKFILGMRILCWLLSFMLEKPL